MSSGRESDAGEPLYADVILPLALSQVYTYRLTPGLAKQVQIGQRVIVQFGKSRYYTAIVERTHRDKPDYEIIKTVHSVYDEEPVVTPRQLGFWRWLADYYMCSIGEVMHAALPAAFKLQSETVFSLHPAFEEGTADLSDREFMVIDALHARKTLNIKEVQELLNTQAVYRTIQSLVGKRAILLEEELIERYKPRVENFLRLPASLESDEDGLKQVFENLERSPKQLAALLRFFQLSKIGRVKRAVLAKEFGQAVVKGLVDKEILEVFKEVVDRVQVADEAIKGLPELSPEQQNALEQIETSFEEHRVTLFRGVTGSGKTEIYIQLMHKLLQEGKTVLYLLPEIALTTQIISRLRKVFGSKVGIYHSRFNQLERYEIWFKIMTGEYPIIVGPRSAVFLPFQRLDLIIVDEEHDASFKQTDPAPRYNARDMAVVLSGIYKAKVLLGSATPSLESYQNACNGKYGKVLLLHRYAGLEMPQVQVVNLSEQYRKKLMKEHFSAPLLEAIKNAKSNGQQVILFQNRRGFAPYLSCKVCEWVPMCRNCDVNLTYHKKSNDLRCHLCGYKITMVSKCGSCASTGLEVRGFGTEKVEHELGLLFPELKIERMDYDTARGKESHERLIYEFESGKIDVLVGTQMVTKGLDFDNVGLVGVLSADGLLYHQDFRASERAFQTLQQVSGRSGRKFSRGLVLIQSYNPAHPVIQQLAANDYEAFFLKEMQQRRLFSYPPFTRIIQITLRHRNVEDVVRLSSLFAGNLRKKLGKRVLGPTFPSVARVRNQFLQNVILKLEKDSGFILAAKNILRQHLNAISAPGIGSGLSYSIDVDPW